MFDLITTAYAESGTSTTAGGGMSSILMIVVMLAIFYFLLIRPENKRKKHLLRGQHWLCGADCPAYGAPAAARWSDRAPDGKRRAGRAAGAAGG